MRDARLTVNAKAMRATPTPAEQALWLVLRARRFEDTKFRRQKVIGRYIVDFASRTPPLVIELDGDTHGTQTKYDAERTRHLEDQGYRVIRFTNSDIVTNLDGVLAAISAAIASPLSQPSPLKERGL